MSDLSKLQQQTVDFTSSWDERKRLFDKLRDLRLNDDDRKTAIAEYTDASKKFDELRAALIRK